MGAETIRTELKASADERVRAGVRGAIEILAGRHGMTPAEQREFANEVDRECGKAIAARGEVGAYCDVMIEEREDQMEVKVRAALEDAKGSSGNKASARSARHFADGENSRQDGAGGREADNGHFVARLVRHFHSKPAHS